MLFSIDSALQNGYKPLATSCHLQNQAYLQARAAHIFFVVEIILAEFFRRTCQNGFFWRLCFGMKKKWSIKCVEILTLCLFAGFYCPQDQVCIIPCPRGAYCVKDMLINATVSHLCVIHINRGGSHRAPVVNKS